MKHPWSTIFNFTYLLVGFIAISYAARASLWLGFVAGIVTVGLGIASGGYHWTGRRRWRHADIIAIYATFFMAMAFQLSELPSFANHKIELFVVFSVLSVIMAYTYHDWTHTQIGLFGLLNLLFLYPRAGLWVTLLTGAFFMIGLIIGREAEQYHKDTRRYDLLHAMWKIPSAAGILFLIIPW